MSKLEKITFRPEGEEPVEFYVLEQTRIGGHNYILVTDVEEGDGDALILKDMSPSIRASVCRNLFSSLRRMISTPCAVKSRLSLIATPTVREPKSKPMIRMWVLLPIVIISSVLS